MITIVRDKLLLSALQEMAEKGFGNLVKCVVDIEKRILVLGGDLHADEEAELLKQGSKQEDLWGINIYPELPYPERVEFDSMINVRPQEGNTTRGIEDPKRQKKVMEIVKALISE
ncbi:MAG: hypothetical protein UW22_C0069G0009 [Candidatus Gottesmanbacteria bacterium GW2011_GWB1_44_11c]|uniref:Uncharacterized protein n=2 Tax=Candidatus Gottesmaniibacteriota TaxID=1752720 RepID=A0A0G1LIC2_9BACT|nr:MAG: hypothetical protein UW22_C0069G0009 [Candidatus Gottesmanbacteria bacterium GW2011_GWB1_44_11c]KKT59564.1 MAG: hypothetical protein UW52_C0037G0012 [Candidatus Gottesmanbacteria bacterium GW2011_GWA1_44_24b]